MPAIKKSNPYPGYIIKPMAHQVVSVKFDDTHERVFDMSDAGTGKTFVRIMAYAFKRRKGKAGKALVLCPRSLMTTAWANDIRKFAPDMQIVLCPAGKRDNIRQEGDIFIANHDGVKELAKMKPAVWKDFTHLFIDESDAFKHHTSDRSKAMVKLSKIFKYRRLMSATPTGNGVTHIWNQALILDEGAALGQSFYEFRSAVCTPKQVGPQATMIKWTDKDGAEEAVFDRLAHMTIRHRREDCLDIPDTQYNVVKYQLTKKQLATYNDMRDAAIAQLGSETITAVNAGVVLQKLLQISSGAVYTGDKDKYVVVDEDRYELIIELARQRKHPLVLFFWRHQLALLTKHAEAAGMKFCVFNGDTTDKERVAQEAAYQRGEYDVIFGHPKTVAYGYTFTRGTSIIWANPSYDAVWWAQANQRQARIGQKHKTEVLTIIAEGTDEEKVYESREAKSKRLDWLLTMFSEAQALGVPAVKVANATRKMLREVKK